METTKLGAQPIAATILGLLQRFTARRPWNQPGMEHWHMPDIGPSTKKRIDRDAGADAPRVESTERSIPRVLFARPECRAVIVDLAAGERMGDHQVKERAVVQVVHGHASFTVDDGQVDATAGSLVVFDPSERHSVDAIEPTRLLLLLATSGAERHAHAPGHLPRNAAADPDDVVS
jgi:quercetin dioxygenase-like cupin family protein